MKKITGIMFLMLMAAHVLAQQKEKAGKLVNEGLAYHEKGNFDKALALYDQALDLDKDNFRALAEKALTLVQLGRYDEAILTSGTTIEKHPNESDLKTVYVTYGNALDGQGKIDEALRVFDEGIKKFPDFFQLYFNKGITLFTDERQINRNTVDERTKMALVCFSKSLELEPAHPQSNYAMAELLSYDTTKRIPAILACMRFLALESEGTRAAAISKLLSDLIYKKNNRTEYVDFGALPDTVQGNNMNYFKAEGMALSNEVDLIHKENNEKQTEVEKFIRYANAVAGSLEKSNENVKGFYGAFYVSYLLEVKKKNLLNTFCYIAFACHGDKDVMDWLKAHAEEVKEFYKWSESFIEKK
jgi:Tfp pilus assembly protein PilF